MLNLRAIILSILLVSPVLSDESSPENLNQSHLSRVIWGVGIPVVYTTSTVLMNINGNNRSLNAFNHYVGYSLVGGYIGTKIYFEFFDKCKVCADGKAYGVGALMDGVLRFVEASFYATIGAVSGGVIAYFTWPSASKNRTWNGVDAALVSIPIGYFVYNF